MKRKIIIGVIMAIIIATVIVTAILILKSQDGINVTKPEKDTISEDIVDIETIKENTFMVYEFEEEDGEKVYTHIINETKSTCVMGTPFSINVTVTHDENGEIENIKEIAYGIDKFVQKGNEEQRLKAINDSFDALMKKYNVNDFDILVLHNGGTDFKDLEKVTIEDIQKMGYSDETGYEIMFIILINETEKYSGTIVTDYDADKKMDKIFISATRFFN